MGFSRGKGPGPGTAGGFFIFGFESDTAPSEAHGHLQKKSFPFSVLRIKDRFQFSVFRKKAISGQLAAKDQRPALACVGQPTGFMAYLRKVIAERGNFSRTGGTDVMKSGSPWWNFINLANLIHFTKNYCQNLFFDLW